MNYFLAFHPCFFVIFASLAILTLKLDFKKNCQEAAIVGHVYCICSSTCSLSLKLYDWSWDSSCKQLNWWFGRKANRWIQLGVLFFNMEFQDYQANSTWCFCQELIQLEPWSTPLSHRVTRGQGVEVGVWRDLLEFGLGAMNPGRAERELYRDETSTFVKGKGLQLPQMLQFESMWKQKRKCSCRSDIWSLKGDVPSWGCWGTASFFRRRFLRGSWCGVTQEPVADAGNSCFSFSSDLMWLGAF